MKQFKPASVEHYSGEIQRSTTWQQTLTSFILISASLFITTSVAHASLNDDTTSIAVTEPHNWSGFYAGLNAGAVKHTMNVTDIQATSFYATIQEAADPNFTGGLQIGYRRQLDLTKTSGVYGLEFSSNFSKATFNQEYGSPFALYQFNAENDLKNVSLLQFIGGIAADKTLLFLAAGVSWSTMTSNMTTLNGAPFLSSFDASKTAIGTAVGGGIEYAFTKAFSARFKLDVITPNPYLTFDDTGNAFQISNNIVQGTIGVNYKFR